MMKMKLHVLLGSVSKFRRGRRALEKRMEEVEGIEDLGGSFFFIIQNPPDLGELKKCIGGGFWRGFRGLR